MQKEHLTVQERMQAIRGHLDEAYGLAESLMAEIIALRRENGALSDELRKTEHGEVDVELASKERAERLRKMTLAEFYDETYHELSSWVYDALLRGLDDGGDTPMEQLLSYMPSELVKNFRNMGLRRVKELIECLRMYGLELAEEKDVKFRKELEKHGIF